MSDIEFVTAPTAVGDVSDFKKVRDVAVMNYRRSTSSGLERAYDFSGIDMMEHHDKYKRQGELCQRAAVWGGASFVFVFVLVVFGVLPAALLYSLLAFSAGSLCGAIIAGNVVQFRAVSTRRALREEVETQMLTVPAGASKAYDRVVAVVEGFEDRFEAGEVTAADVAEARMVRDGTEVLLREVSAHHKAGTLHTGNGQAVLEELYRLGGEADAYDMVRSSGMVTAADESAAAVLGRTRELGFAGSAMECYDWDE